MPVDSAGAGLPRGASPRHSSEASGAGQGHDGGLNQTQSGQSIDSRQGKVLGAPGTAAQLGAGLGAVGSSETVWRGGLRMFLNSERRNIEVPCIAVKEALPSRPQIQSTQSWPSILQCETRKKRSECAHLMAEPTTQWYVRFLIDPETSSTLAPNFLSILANALKTNEFAFEVPCGAAGGPPGTLYICGTAMPEIGLCLIGVFRPTPNAPAGDDVSFMNSLMGT